VLDAGVDVLADVLISQGPTALELRQNSPFAGVISEEVRSRVLASFRGTGLLTTMSPATSPPVATFGLIPRRSAGEPSTAGSHFALSGVDRG
jgi:hypothetical protein